MRPARTITARYAGTCTDCGLPIAVGETIHYRKPDAVHEACTLPDTPTTTHRERMEARADRREQWAESRATKAATSFHKADAIASMIPMGQPILVGHHSEGRHRRDLGRIDSGMRNGIEHEQAAERHADAADGIRGQLARSIYDDDPDAIEQLRAKLAKLEAQREAVKAHNKQHRTEAACTCPGDCACRSRYQPTRCDCTAHPLPTYVLQNLGGNITRTRQRLARLERQATR